MAGTTTSSNPYLFRRGDVWWHDDGEEVLEQFDWMLVGLMTVQAEYVRYCARRSRRSPS